MKDILMIIAGRLHIPNLGICSFSGCTPLLPCRAARRIPAGARSVIVAVFPYYTGELLGANVCRYARVADYHQVVGGLLGLIAEELGSRFPGEAFVPFVDNSPIPEVDAACAAGLGVKGKNGLLITREYGTFVVIGSIVTTLPLSADAPRADACAGCGRCLAACPTGALDSGGFRRELCRSHITQKKGELTPWEQEQVRRGGLVWGCDICAECCPHNRSVRPTPIAAFQEGIEPVYHPAEAARLLGRMPYGYRGEAVVNRNWHLIQSQSITKQNETTTEHAEQRK